MKVFWTKFALSSLSNIYRYYKDNVSISIAENIKDSVLLSANQLELQPLSGTKEDILHEIDDSYRFIIRGNYKIIYKIENNNIFITDVFDTRQDPGKIKLRNTMH